MIDTFSVYTDLHQYLHVWENLAVIILDMIDGYVCYCIGIHFKNDRLTRQVFEWDFNQFENGHNNWFNDLREIFSSVDILHMYYSIM